MIQQQRHVETVIIHAENVQEQKKQSVINATHGESWKLTEHVRVPNTKVTTVEMNATILVALVMEKAPSSVQIVPIQERKNNILPKVV